MFKRITFIALAALGLAACAKQELSVETRVPEKLTASMEEFTSKTKVQLNEEMKTVWTEGDQLTVFYKNEQNDCWQFDGETGDRNGTFSRVSDEEIAAPTLKDAFIVYPYAENTTFEPEQNRITIEIPSVQTYTEGSYAPGSNIMFAKTQSERFTMKNLTGYVMFQLKGDQKVKSIKLTGKQQENVSGAAYISTENELIDYIDDMNNTDEVETRAGTDSSKELVLDCGEGVQLDKNTATTFYLALVPRVFQEGFEIEIECTNGFTLKKSTKGSFAIRRNTIYKMKEFDVNPSAEEVPLTPEAVFEDVSEEGTKTANSYIITSDGYYKFPAVMGNDITKTVDNVAKVEVLWESFGTEETTYKRDLITALDYEDGYISFETTDKKGNALIAAKDADNNILWSWHIWMTEDPEIQVYNNGAGEMMDRNLGATSANPEDGTKTFGLLYQWGRKDPFMGRSLNSVVKTTLSEWPNVQSTEETGSIDYTIKNPTTFILNDDSDWFFNEETVLWASEKTIYDPCPAGYKVPDGGANGIWARALDKSDSYTDEALYASNYSGFKFTGDCNPPISAGEVWYPFTCFKHSENGSFNGIDFGYVWSCDKDYYFFYGRYNGNTVNPNAEPTGTANAYAVRCYKEDSAEPIDPIDLSENGQGGQETANSYIVSKKGYYKFPAVKGNDQNEALSGIQSAQVFWESFGTDEAINPGDLISGVNLSIDGYISFKATGKKGNALIAAVGQDGVLWSWHIWLTDAPKDQEYNYGGGTMMDRNLGATSANREDGDKTFGLLYQWGRKDPFLGKTNGNKRAASTRDTEILPWPTESVENTQGKIDYSIKKPTVFITAGTGEGERKWMTEENVTLWDFTKTIYDPCPPGYQVPDGSESGIWERALNSIDAINASGIYDQVNNGFYFVGDSETSVSLSDDDNVWYPCVASAVYTTGDLSAIGTSGYVWGFGYDDTGKNYQFRFIKDNNQGEKVYPTDLTEQAFGLSVRCYKIDSAEGM